MPGCSAANLERTGLSSIAAILPRSDSRASRPSSTSFRSLLRAFFAFLSSFWPSVLATVSSSRSSSSVSFRGRLVHLRLAVVVVHQLANEPIEPGQFVNGIVLIGLGIAEIAEAVDDHAELGPPVANVVVRHHLVARKTQAARKSRHRSTWNGCVPRAWAWPHLGQREIDHIGLRLGCRRHSQPLIAHGRGQLFHDPLVADPQVDEPGPRHFGAPRKNLPR